VLRHADGRGKQYPPRGTIVQQQRSIGGAAPPTMRTFDHVQAVLAQFRYLLRMFLGIENKPERRRKAAAASRAGQ
jgi:hypothetical protein